jgi:hypothetical protein
VRRVHAGNPGVPFREYDNTEGKSGRDLISPSFMIPALRGDIFCGKLYHFHFAIFI